METPTHPIGCTFHILSVLKTMSGLRFRILAIVISLTTASGAFATTWTDSGADNLWENAANWNAGVPTTNDYALIDGGGSGPLVAAGYTAFSALMDVGLANSGSLTIDGGFVDSPPGINIGKNSGATGTITVEADGSVAGGWITLQSWFITLGESGGDGTLINNGAMIKVWSEWFNIAAWGGTGHVQLNGGKIISRGLHIGSGGTIDIAGGTLAVAGDQLEALSELLTSGQLTAYGVSNDITRFEYDYNVTTPEYTTLSAYPPAVTIPPLQDPVDLYLEWAGGFGLTDTNAAAALSADPDADRLNNLAEYSSGGSPTNGNDQGNIPTSEIVPAGGGSNWFEYAHFERSDKNKRGLTYSLEQCPDLVDAAWTNGEISTTATGTLNTEFNTATNRIAMDSEEGRFLRLRVGFEEHPPGLQVGSTGTLMKEDLPYQGFGANYFNAFERVLLNRNDTSYDAGFEYLAQKGVPFVRVMFCGFWAKQNQLYLDDKEEYFRRLDGVVASAQAHGVGIIPGLFWTQWAVPDLVGEPCGSWNDPDSATMAYMRQYVQDVVTRYKDLPIIWGWEFGNEWNLWADLIYPHNSPPIAVAYGATPATRSSADDVSHETVVFAISEFAKEVRKHDPQRMISSGHASPRAEAWNLWKSGQWVQDTPQQHVEVLIAQNPDPVDVISIHVYPESYSYDVAADVAISEGVGKPLYIGEYGISEDAFGTPTEISEAFYSMLEEYKSAGVPLSAVWVFDLPQQEGTWNISPDNNRTYMIDAVGRANEL